MPSVVRTTFVMPGRPSPISVLVPPTFPVTYGPVGTVLVIQSWLVGVGVVVFGGALVGRLLYEELPRMAHAPKRRK
ncbi:uncharacterized BrkB/YihY/UPF0761 family membrane protein [Streptomyces sp. V4I8]